LLLRAVAKNQLGAVRVLLEMGADKEAWIREVGHTLSETVYSHRICTYTLTSSSCSSSSSSQSRQRSIHIAAFHGHRDILAALLDVGVKIDVQDKVPTYLRSPYNEVCLLLI
jgi:ankyrin repeat protein